MRQRIFTKIFYSCLQKKNTHTHTQEKLDKYFPWKFKSNPKIFPLWTKVFNNNTYLEMETNFEVYFQFIDIISCPFSVLKSSEGNIIIEETVLIKGPRWPRLVVGYGLRNIKITLVTMGCIKWHIQISFRDAIFTKGVWSSKLPEFQKDIIVIFEESFSVFNIMGVTGRGYLQRKNVTIICNYQL